MYALYPVYDNRKSFYGKAQIKLIDGVNVTKELYSYDTLVATIEYTKDNKTIFTYNGYYSQTTTRHQKDWELLKKKGTITYAENGDLI